jgi:quercetin dioxygenase-like cupin family protein
VTPSNYKNPDLMNIGTVSIIAWSCLLPASLLLAQSPSKDAHPEQAKFYSSEKIEWKDGPPLLPTGAKVALLEGDPAKEAPFVMRLLFPAGYHIPPHTHPKTERVTVISGALYLAMGDNLDRSTAQKLSTGTYGFWPAGMKHAAWAESETAIQVHGIGPWIINYVNPADDPRNAKKSL